MPATPAAEHRPSAARAYRVLVGSRIRAQASYRASFAVDVAASLFVGVVEFAEIALIFGNVDVLGGLTLQAALLVFAFSSMAFALATTMTGGLDDLPTLIRTGTVDVVMLRPLSVLGQLVANDVALKRLGRCALAVVVMAVSLHVLPIVWTPTRALLVVTTVLSGVAIYSALFVLAGAVQFWLVDGSEFTAAFTYAGGYAGQNSGALFALPLRVFVTFVIPATFVGYLPTLALLDAPAPTALPSWLGWCSPVAAALALLVTIAVWRRGVQHYTGAGG